MVAAVAVAMKRVQEALARAPETVKMVGPVGPVGKLPPRLVEILTADCQERDDPVRPDRRRQAHPRADRGDERLADVRHRTWATDTTTISWPGNSVRLPRMNGIPNCAKSYGTNIGPTSAGPTGATKKILIDD